MTEKQKATLELFQKFRTCEFWMDQDDLIIKRKTTAGQSVHYEVRPDGAARGLSHWHGFLVPNGPFY